MALLDIDIQKILTEDSWTPCTLDGEQVVHKYFPLSPMQLGMFNELNVTQLPDGTVWLDFLSEKYAPAKPAMDFMAYCYHKWGLDSQGRGVPSNADVQALRNGTFGRTWTNVKMLQFKRPNHLSLTIALRIIIDNQDLSDFIGILTQSTPEAPIANTNNVNISESIATTVNTEEATDADPNDTPNVIVGFSIGKIILLCLLSLFLFPVGNIGVIIYGLTKYLQIPTPYSTTIVASNKKKGITAISIALGWSALVGMAFIFS